VHPRDRGRIFDLSRAHQAYHPFKIIAGAVRVSEEPVPDARARRAIPLIAAALTVIVVAGLLYLRASDPASTAVKSPPPVPILSGQYAASYDFMSPALGWAVVVQQQATPTFWVYATTDGAHTWAKRFTGGLAQGEPAMIHFFDRDHGIFYAGVLYRTSNGGATWSVISVPEGTPNFVFASATRAWAVISEPDQVPTTHVYSTVDGGLFWQRVDWSLPAGVSLYGKGLPMSLGFRADGEGWTGAEELSPTVYTTRDGGASWRAIALPTPAQAAPTPVGKGFLGYNTSVVLIPGNGVIAQVGDYSGSAWTFTSFDRGQSWRLISPPPSPAGLSDLSFVDSRHWWASRWDTLFKTSDAGQTWTAVPTVAPDISGDWTFGPAQVIDSQHAWLLMSSANRRSGATGLMMTSDGGVNWTAANVPKPG